MGFSLHSSLLALQTRLALYATGIFFISIHHTRLFSWNMKLTFPTGRLNIPISPALPALGNVLQWQERCFYLYSCSYRWSWASFHIILRLWCFLCEFCKWSIHHIFPLFSWSISFAICRSFEYRVCQMVRGSIWHTWIISTLKCRSSGSPVAQAAHRPIHSP